MNNFDVVRVLQVDVKLLTIIIHVLSLDGIIGVVLNYLCKALYSATFFVGGQDTLFLGNRISLREVAQYFPKCLILCIKSVEMSKNLIVLHIRVTRNLVVLNRSGSFVLSDDLLMLIDVVVQNLMGSHVLLLVITFFDVNDRMGLLRWLFILRLHIC